MLQEKAVMGAGSQSKQKQSPAVQRDLVTAIEPSKAIYLGEPLVLTARSQPLH